MAKKTVNSDIYNIAGLINDVNKEFLPDEDEETLAVGIYGAITSINSRRLQTQVQMTGELSNEIFPSRARLERNIITHAITSGVTGINATPAKMTVFLAIKESDIVDLLDENNTFTIDRECPIYFDDFEFHLEYDIILKKIQSAYTAMYDMTRVNPSSDIENEYLSAPAIINLNGEPYIYITTIISQVIHNTVSSKVITSDAIANKTINFEFENQLAYFEVCCKESDNTYWIEPILEGSTSTDITAQYYCWYQYIDTNYIRIRFDSGSYTPNLSTEVSVLFKTSTGASGNFKYSDDINTSFTSSNYGYKNINIIVSPLTESKDGKDRKSKKELQSLIPKEMFARDSLTTSTDLDNYFSMLDSDYCRMKIQKKCDNQKERVNYAYYVAKDSDENVIPTNTIDVKIPKEKLVEYESSSGSKKYILKPGQMIKYDLTNKQGTLNNIPVDNTKLNFSLPSGGERQKVILTFKAKVTDTSYDTIGVSANVYGIESVKLISPGTYIYTEKTEEDSRTLSDNYKFNFTLYTQYKLKTTINGTGSDITISIPAVLNDDNERIAEYELWYKSAQDESETEIGSWSGTNYIGTIPNSIAGLVYSVWLKIKYVDEALKEIGSTYPDYITHTLTLGSASINFFGYPIRITQNPVISTSLTLNQEIEYTVTYHALSANAPKFYATLSRGLEYVTGAQYIFGSGTALSIEPIKEAISSTGFLYFNPYTININENYLYSTFYMMTMNENPYLHFDYVNKASNVQFIATNADWARPLSGTDKDKYSLGLTITASVQDSSLGLTASSVKCIVAFIKNESVYKYRSLDCESFNGTTYSYYFGKEFPSTDQLDEQNYIKIMNVEDPGYVEDSDTKNKYGLFEPNTDIRIYTLCNIPDISGEYSRTGGAYPIDSFCPGLTGWTVTNIFSVPNNINFYYNYAEIMSSRVTPYGTTSEGVLTLEGYIVKGVPAVGYDYCLDETNIDNLIADLNYRKSYLDNALKLFENTYGIDFKFFNTYGPSNTYYIVKDPVGEATKSYLDRVNISIKFRVKLTSSKDSYTISNIKSDIKEYIESFDDFSDLHIPNLISEITQNYSEQIVYIEFLGINDYGADIQHLYKDEDEDIDIHDAPEFLNIYCSKDSSGTFGPEISIYTSDI